jgi:hypothetical protein
MADVLSLGQIETLAERDGQLGSRKGVQPLWPPC